MALSESRKAMHRFLPDWPAPVHVRALTCADAERTAELQLPAEPAWLEQVHGAVHVRADDVAPRPAADAAWTRMSGVVCAVRTADCLPVLMCDREGSMVMAVHAGWRGLCSGVVDLAADRFAAEGIAPHNIMAWLGPAICPEHYEVDAAVRDAFMARTPDCREAFRPVRRGHWLFDLYAAARRVLGAAGIDAVYGGDQCTWENPAWSSYRRDPACGRMASLIWLARTDSEL